MKNQTSKYKFRRYNKIEGGSVKKAKHPKLIVDIDENYFGFMGLSESDKKGHHKNIKLDQNPKKNDSRPAYIRKEIRFDKQENFGKELDNYQLSPKDKKTIEEYVKPRLSFYKKKNKK